MLMTGVDKYLLCCIGDAVVVVVVVRDFEDGGDDPNRDRSSMWNSEDMVDDWMVSWLADCNDE